MLGFASKGRSFTVARQQSEEAMALAARYGWDGDAAIAPGMVGLGGTMVWMGELDEGERWLKRAAGVAHAEADPATGLRLHLATGLLRSEAGARPDWTDSWPPSA